jgi:hypothetical protein
MKNPYEMHGLELTGDESDIERVTNCWCCGKEQHMYINSETTQYDCKVCGESGNLFTFIRSLYDESKKQTKTIQYVKLAKAKSLPPEVAVKSGIAKSSIADDLWLMPGYSEAGKMVNLYVYDQTTNKIYSTATLNQTVLLQEKIKPKAEKLVIAEGHWDTYLLDWLYADDENVSVIGAPGANTLPKTASKYFANKDILIPFDNDQAGLKGIDRIAKLSSETAVKPMRVSYLAWPKDLAKGFDIRDLYAKIAKSDPNNKDVESVKAQMREWIQKNQRQYKKVLVPKKGADTETAKVAVSQEDTGVEPMECESFDDLCEILESLGYRMFDSYRQMLAVMLAVVISVEMLGPMLWIYVVGPSGIGKTMLCDLISGATKYVKAISKFNGLLSGWNDGSGNDSSLLPIINNKALVVKDLTAILSGSEQVREKLFGEMRDAYDGYSSAHYGNNVHHDYTDVNFSFIAGVTDAIKNYNNTDLGERFLHADMEAGFTIGDPSPEIVANRKQILKSLVMGKRDIGFRRRKQASQKTDESIGRAYTYGFIDYLFRRMETQDPPEIPAQILDKIGSLALLIAAVRTKVKRTHQGELAYKPRQESAFRTARQLKKLCFGYTVVMQKPIADEEIWQTIKRIGLETAAGSAQYEFDIVRLLSSNRFKMTAQEISAKIGISVVATRRYLNNLRELETIDVQTIPNGKGQKAHKFGLAKEIRDSWRDIFND